MKGAPTGPWPAGINNRLPGYSLPQDQYQRLIALRNAVNVDLDHQGNARRRQGYTKIYSGFMPRDAFACDVGVFFIESNNLMRLNADNTVSFVDAGWFGPVCYECFNGVVYLSDGLRTAKVVSGVVSAYPEMPPCSILAQHNGRLYGVAGKTVWHTDPFTEVVDPQRNFLQFTEDVTVFMPVTGGVWVVADKTYFYAGGGPEDFTPRMMLEYGAVPRTAVRVPKGNDVTWYSTRGVVLATAGGEIKNLQEPNVAPDVGSYGASLYREENGIKQMVVSVVNPSISPMAARDWMDMEVVRRAS